MEPGTPAREEGPVGEGVKVVSGGMYICTYVSSRYVDQCSTYVQDLFMILPFC